MVHNALKSSKEIRVLIIDEHPDVAYALRDGLTELGCMVCGVACNYMDALNLLQASNYDIVLLDMHLGGKDSGLLLGKLLCELYKKPYLFTTAKDDNDHLATAISVRPMGYLLKPISPISLVITINGILQHFEEATKVERTIERPDDNFFVKMGDKYKKLNWNDVVYMRSDQRYTCMFNSCDQKEYPIRSTLIKTLQNIVPQHKLADFVQINRAEAVQIAHIAEMSGDIIKTPYNTMYVTEGFGKLLKTKAKFLA